jgi:PhoPQ-activated pathogenicity-related protein
MSLRRRIAALSVFWPILAATAFGYGAEPPASRKTALDDYIAKADPTYSWKLVKTIRGDGYSTFVVDLQSQSWRTIPEVDRPVWQHWLVIIKPDLVKHDTALLHIGGGKNGAKAPDKPNPQLVLVAKKTNTVVADLGMVPNQPLVFCGDGQARVEDDLIAACWSQYLDTGDATWLPRLPMVKSAVRAMDAVTELLAGDKGGKIAIGHFVVSGGSKRGWTTWLTGAVDKRVVAIIPVVIDVVNVRACSRNHYEAYGFWAPALGDYTRHKIHERAESPRYAELLKIVDPYSYRDRLTMPKFVVNSAGDQYFPPDSSKFYFNDLQGIKYLRYVPNSNHSLAGSDTAGSILAFYQAFVEGRPLPKFSWKMQADGSIRVQTQTAPLAVNVWQATNPKARDFRLLSIGPAYRKTALSSQGDGVYLAKVEKPASGWTAFFVELVFPSGEPIPFKFTTQVQIVPDVLPHSYEEFRRAPK